MNSSDLHKLFRLGAFDTEEPYLWSDAEIFAYIDDANKMFVRLTGGVPDFTSPVTKVLVEEGVGHSLVSPLILRYVSARVASTNRHLDIVNSHNLKLDYRKGRLTHMVIGMQRDAVVWSPIPEEDDEVLLEIRRLPDYTIDDFDQELPDVEEHHHIHLLQWVRALAFRKNDAETINIAKANECEALFRQYCESVEREYERENHRPRTMHYGGL